MSILCTPNLETTEGTDPSIQAESKETGSDLQKAINIEPQQITIYDKDSKPHLINFMGLTIYKTADSVSILTFASSEKPGETDKLDMADEHNETVLYITITHTNDINSGPELQARIIQLETKNREQLIMRLERLRQHPKRREGKSRQHSSRSPESDMLDWLSMLPSNSIAVQEIARILSPRELDKIATAAERLPRDSEKEDSTILQMASEADDTFQKEYGDIFKEELTITLPNPDDPSKVIQYAIKGFYIGELEEDELGETRKSKVFALPPVIEVFAGKTLVSMSIPVIKMGGEPSKMIGFELIRVPVSPSDLRRQLIGYGISLNKIENLSLTTEMTAEILNIMYTLRDQHQRRYEEDLNYAILDITSFGEFIISERVLQRIKEQKFESIPGLDNGEPTNVKFLFKHMSKILNTITE